MNVFDISDLVVDKANEYFNEIKKNSNGRLRSWEHCYYNFYKARKTQNIDFDFLSLHFAFYLASWGMYRGSSFLLQKDYKIHIPVIKEILNKKYDVLFNIDCEHILLKENQNLLIELNNSISKHYERIRQDVKQIDIEKDISQTLITKILMGTMGCVPAYDRYFILGIKEHKIASTSFSIESIVQLAKFYQDHSEKFEKARKNFIVNDNNGIFYPQMKFLDMGFWQLGIKNV